MKVNIENCEKNAELFGKALCEKLGWQLAKFLNNDIWYLPPNFPDYQEYYHYCSRLAYSKDLVSEAEKAVIEKVGYAYMWALIRACDYPKQNLYTFSSFGLDDVIRFATAGAKTRLVACLVALGITEIEDKL